MRFHFFGTVPNGRTDDEAICRFAMRKAKCKCHLLECFLSCNFVRRNEFAKFPPNSNKLHHKFKTNTEHIMCKFVWLLASDKVSQLTCPTERNITHRAAKWPSKSGNPRPEESNLLFAECFRMTLTRLG